MKVSNVIMALVALLVLGTYSYNVLISESDSSLPKQELPTDTKEFIWVRMDSLSQGIKDYSGNNVKIDSTSSSKYTLKYNSKQYLLHEHVDGITENRNRLIVKAKDEMKYKETDSTVVIILKRNGEYVYCPALILGRVLQWKSKYQYN